MKRKIALTLAISMLLSHASFAAGLSFSIDTPLADGLTYVEGTSFLEDGKNNHTYTLEYTPGKSALPVVAWGELQKSRKTLTKIAELYGSDVVAAINADFFSFQTGIPLGCVVSDGRFLSSSVKNNALAVYPDGSLYIGTPDIASTFTYGEATFDFYYNKYPQPYNPYILDSTYHTSTASTYSCLEIVLIPESEELFVNSTTLCTVEQVMSDAMDTPIEEGTLVLSIPKSHPSYKALEGIQTGETIEISVTASDTWAEARQVIGGGEIIVKDSVFIPETADEYADKVRYARTAVGLREDGTAIFFAVNGKREGYSSGMTFKELADTLIAKGAVTVLNLDGGGSTTVGIKYSGEEKLDIVNYPSDGYQRGLANAILFLNTAIPDGNVTNVSFFPDVYFILPNTEIKASSAFFDSSMTQLEDYEPFNAEYFSLSDGAEFEVSTLRITDSAESEREIAAVYTLEDGSMLTDDKTFYVPDKLDSLTVTAGKSVLDVGGSTSLNINAEYRGFEVANSPACFSWSFSENNVEALAEGVLAENDVARLYSDGTVEIITDTLFTAATLTASYGDLYGSVDIYVGMPDIVLDDFEPVEELTEEPTEEPVEEPTEEPVEEPTEEPVEEPTEEPVEEPTEELVEEHIPTGYRSENGATLESGSMTYDAPIEVELTPKAITLMYNGKFTDNASVVIIASDGSEIALPYEVSKDYSELTGWTELIAYLPEDISGVIYVKSPFVSHTETPAVIDMLTAAYGFSLPVFDDVGDSWAKDYIQTVYDMGLISGYTEDGRLIYAPDRRITRAEFAKLVSSYQRYTYGNSELTFNDTSDIPQWAIEYVGAVSENGIMNGRAEGDGSLTFAPNDPITRTEAMLVLSRMMPDGDSVADLTFTDTADVPEWALEGVKKTVAAGIITGYDDNTVKPSNNITRAETAVVFSRLFSFMHPAPQIPEQPVEDTSEEITLEESVEIESDSIEDVIIWGGQ